MNKIRKCSFLAAGYGTRFLPATKAIPKEMLPVLTKPLLQYGVEEAVSVGLDTMAIVTGRGKHAIEDHCDRSYGLKHQITDVLLEQVKQGKVIAYKFQGQRFDCGSVDGFVEATNYFYKKTIK